MSSNKKLQIFKKKLSWLYDYSYETAVLLPFVPSTELCQPTDDMDEDLNTQSEDNEFIIKRILNPSHFGISKAKAIEIQTRNTEIAVQKTEREIAMQNNKEEIEIQKPEEMVESEEFVSLQEGNQNSLEKVSKEVEIDTDMKAMAKNLRNLGLLTRNNKLALRTMDMMPNTFFLSVDRENENEYENKSPRKRNDDYMPTLKHIGKCHQCKKHFAVRTQDITKLLRVQCTKAHWLSLDVVTLNGDESIFYCLKCELSAACPSCDKVAFKFNDQHVGRLIFLSSNINETKELVVEKQDFVNLSLVPFENSEAFPTAEIPNDQGQFTDHLQCDIPLTPPECPMKVPLDNLKDFKLSIVKISDSKRGITFGLPLSKQNPNFKIGNLKIRPLSSETSNFALKRCENPFSPPPPIISEDSIFKIPSLPKISSSRGYQETPLESVYQKTVTEIGKNEERLKYDEVEITATTGNILNHGNAEDDILSITVIKDGSTENEKKELDILSNLGSETLLKNDKFKFSCSAERLRSKINWKLVQNEFMGINWKDSESLERNSLESNRNRLSPEIIDLSEQDEIQLGPELVNRHTVALVRNSNKKSEGGTQSSDLEKGRLGENCESQMRNESQLSYHCKQHKAENLLKHTSSIKQELLHKSINMLGRQDLVIEKCCNRDSAIAEECKESAKIPKFGTEIVFNLGHLDEVQNSKNSTNEVSEIVVSQYVNSGDVFVNNSIKDKQLLNLCDLEIPRPASPPWDWIQGNNKMIKPPKEIIMKNKGWSVTQIPNLKSGKVNSISDLIFSKGFQNMDIFRELHSIPLITIPSGEIDISRPIEENHVNIPAPNQQNQLIVKSIELSNTFTKSKMGIHDSLRKPEYPMNQIHQTNPEFPNEQKINELRSQILKQIVEGGSLYNNVAELKGRYGFEMNNIIGTQNQETHQNLFGTNICSESDSDPTHNTNLQEKSSNASANQNKYSTQFSQERLPSSSMETSHSEYSLSDFEKFKTVCLAKAAQGRLRNQDNDNIQELRKNYRQTGSPFPISFTNSQSSECPPSILLHQNGGIVWNSSTIPKVVTHSIPSNNSLIHSPCVAELQHFFLSPNERNITKSEKSNELRQKNSSPAFESPTNPIIKDNVLPESFRRKRKRLRQPCDNLYCSCEECTTFHHLKKRRKSIHSNPDVPLMAVEEPLRFADQRQHLGLSRIFPIYQFQELQGKNRRKIFSNPESESPSQNTRKAVANVQGSSSSKASSVSSSSQETIPHNPNLGNVLCRNPFDEPLPLFDDKNLEDKDAQIMSTHRYLAILHQLAIQQNPGVLHMPFNNIWAQRMQNAANINILMPPLPNQQIPLFTPRAQSKRSAERKPLPKT